MTHHINPSVAHKLKRVEELVRLGYSLDRAIEIAWKE